MELIWPPWASLPGHEPGDARVVEVRLRLIKGRTRYAEVVGGVRNRRLFHRDPPQHLVFHLDDVSRIEEAALLELGVAHLAGGRVQRALVSQVLDLCTSAASVIRHVDFRPAQDAKRNGDYGATDRPVKTLCQLRVHGNSVFAESYPHHCGVIHFTVAAKLSLHALPSVDHRRSPRSVVSLASSIKSTTRKAERPLPITTSGSGATRSVHCAGTGQMTPSSKRKSSRFPNRL